MNAVIALCHFCELHGPRILFSTQAYHNEPGKLGSNGAALFRSRSETGGSTSSVGSERSGGTAGSQRTELCEACRSIQHGHSGFISYDHNVGISYTSSQYPSQPQIFTMVRQACIRSLSCEVCPGREGPIFFGDEHYGYTLSYTFFVKDSQARGFQRWYSIIVVMMDKMFLLNSWPFLTSNIRSIIDKIQAQAISIYEKEQAAKSERAERINRQLHAHDVLPPRGGGTQAFRSLIDLTGDKQLFRYLHMLFAWILMAGGSRFTEKFLEGPPNEEEFLDFAREEETEEGFIKVTTRHPETEKVQTDEVLNSSEAELSYSDDGGMIFRSLSHFRQVIGSINFHDLAYHILTGNQLIVRSQSKCTLKSAFDVLKTLLPAGIGTTIVFSDKYEESWKCNFLGLSLDTGIPEYVLASELYIALDIIPEERNPTDYTKVMVDSNDPFHGFGIAIKSSATVPDTVPTFQSRVEHMMDNTSLDENVISTFLAAIKQEWMNKVKMLFKFTRAGNHTEEETNRLLKILQAEKRDEPLLKYWKMGLSSQYKSHLLTESMGLASPSSS
ncbi:hypothetical protein BSL78_23679 [Apostichopus japonicus]|uniref:Folliculin n=1 Tax=Stichopus japonicus TaxID=307972 RepID=A0A2G8JUP2_STIJA|nr:hypothetical protein BSL78_23679 [Apostichopus japonicus]